MAKLTINDITAGYASNTALNTAFTAIETALENTVSRDGTSPNQMGANLDMNGYAILNQKATSGNENFVWAGTWLPNTHYDQNNLVYAAEGTELGNGLICTTAHTSASTLDADMVDPSNWDVYVQKGASVGGIAGPVSSTVNYLSQWSDTTGTTLKNGVPIGSGGGVQAYDALLTSLAAQTTANNNVQAYSGVDTATLLSTGTASGNIPLVGTSSATTTLAGLSELADSSEAVAGTNALKTLTPATLRNSLAATGTAPIYACRAWINFDGPITGIVARASGNATATRTGVGLYTVTFITPMSDTNYAVTASCALSGVFISLTGTKTASEFYLVARGHDGVAYDVSDISVIVVR